MAPELTLPPQPILTRWGTWISAACYYANNFTKIKKIIQNLDEDSAAFIFANYSLLPSTITSLESRDLLLTDAVSTVNINNAISAICSISGNKGRVIKEKCEAVFAASKDFEIVKNLANIFSGNTNVTNHVDYEIMETVVRSHN
ncbi:hypothetical protein RN001_002246 [Aquatica leii]|uniref:Uncharacterized protein n=1 Tax=Aquatica leii TaxID=1421715 RepID=A0AAN7SST1_9COLE|nr:hypothetical protein RN001_002246 [Aquatica leii]